MSRVVEQVGLAGRKFFADQWQILPPVNRSVVRPLNNLNRHPGLSCSGKALLVIGHRCDPGGGQCPGLQTVMLPEKAKKTVVVTVPCKAPSDTGQKRSGQVEHIATQRPPNRIKQRAQQHIVRQCESLIQLAMKQAVHDYRAACALGNPHPGPGQFCSKLENTLERLRILLKRADTGRLA